MPERRPLAIVMNPASAGGKPLRLLPAVKQALGAAGVEFRLVETRDIPHASEAAQEAAGRGEVVVALGGDGLVGSLAGALRGSGTLGVLPGGRGNDFARAIGIPKDIGEACRVLLEGEERVLDLGDANGRPFACIASTGYDSEANRIANEARLVRGNLVYAYAAILALVRWKPASFEIVVDGAERRFDGYTVAAANTSYYGGGMKMAPGADPTDGMLDVILVGRSSKRRFLANLPKVFAGTHVELDVITVLRAREVEIRADRPFDVYADGEPITSLPAAIKLIPGALRVIAPVPQSGSLPKGP